MIHCGIAARNREFPRSMVYRASSTTPSTRAFLHDSPTEPWNGSISFANPPAAFARRSSNLIERARELSGIDFCLLRSIDEASGRAAFGSCLKIARSKTELKFSGKRLEFKIATFWDRFSLERRILITLLLQSNIFEILDTFNPSWSHLRVHFLVTIFAFSELLTFE